MGERLSRARVEFEKKGGALLAVLGAISLNAVAVAIGIGSYFWGKQDEKSLKGAH